MTDEPKITRSLTREQWEDLIVDQYYRDEKWTFVCGWCMRQITKETPHFGTCPLAEQEKDDER